MELFEEVRVNRKQVKRRRVGQADDFHVAQQQEQVVQLARLPPHTPRTVSVPLGRRIASAFDRHQFYTVRLRDGVAFPAFKGSGDITSLSQADGYIEIPADQSVVEEGASVTVTLF